MVRTGATGTSAPDGRLSRPDRHDALLDTAAALLETGGASAVTMEAVAANAGPDATAPSEDGTTETTEEKA